MREVRDLAAGMKEAIASLRKASADAKAALSEEMSRATGNADKVRTFIKELKEANQEVEAFLGEAGSNFPPSEDSVIQQPHMRKMEHTVRRADINGVMLNQEAEQ